MDTPIRTLTPVERLQLANHFEILAQLYPQQADIFNARREIVSGGYSIEYDDVFSDIFDEMPYEECKYVYDVLDMHRNLINSLNALKDKQGLTLDDVKFEGFDGNNESKRHAFAKHLQKEGKWTETLVGSLNSHSQSTISRYPKMLKKYDKVVETLDTMAPGGWDLTAEQIREIIS